MRDQFDRGYAVTHPPSLPLSPYSHLLSLLPGSHTSHLPLPSPLAPSLSLSLPDPNPPTPLQQITKAYQLAVKENDSIYHETPPPYAKLAPVDGTL